MTTFIETIRKMMGWRPVENMKIKKPITRELHANESVEGENKLR